MSQNKKKAPKHGMTQKIVFKSKNLACKVYDVLRNCPWKIIDYILEGIKKSKGLWGGGKSKILN